VFSNLLLVATRSLLSLVTETSVYLAVAHQRSSDSGSTILVFSRHVTTYFKVLKLTKAGHGSRAV
jgi:hypothetical protein